MYNVISENELDPKMKFIETWTCQLKFSFTLQDARHFGWNVPENISISWYVLFLCDNILFVKSYLYILLSGIPVNSFKWGVM